jgi:hypothetical protein
VTEHDDHHDDREERAILAALGWLEGSPDETPAAPDDGGDADAALRRLSVETLGLLPWALDPEAPRAGARERLLAALPERPESPASPSPSVRLFAPTPPPAEARTEPGPAAGRRSRASALAAVFVAAAIGLAGVAGWLWLELGETREHLAEAESALAGSEADRSELAGLVASQEAALRRRAGMEKFLAAASTSGVEICPLRPVGDPALHPEAFAVLYMPPGSGKWYLVASNLRPGDQGVYKVWLNTPDGPVPVGRLDAGEDSALEFQLPPDVDERHELMLSIVVTLEPEPESPAPEGPTILFGDEKLQIL